MTNNVIRAGALWSIAALIMVATPLAAGDEVWVRVDRPSTSQLAEYPTLVDYGSFAWGAVSADELPALRSAVAGIREVERPFELRLGGLRFDPLEAFPELESGGAHERTSSANFHLIQFQGPIRNQWLQDVRAQGVEIIQYIHPYTYVVWADQEQLGAARNANGVRWAGEFAAEFRVVPEQRGFTASDEPTMLAISRHADERTVRDQIEAAGGEVLQIAPYTAHLSVVKALAPGARYLDLGRIPAVYTVQRGHRMELRGEMSNQAVVGNYGGAPNYQIVPGYADWLNTTGYDGTGVIVSIMDNGVLTTHVDLEDRMTPCVTDDTPTSCGTATGGHGTHVAGAVAGTGATGTVLQGFLRGQGVAPGANLVRQVAPNLNAWWGAQCTDPEPEDGGFCMSPIGMLRLFKEAALSGALVANNSWGSPGYQFGYDLITQQVDVMVRDANPDEPGAQPVLPVWSIQNGNGDMNTGHICAPASLGSPEEAKNLFAVGATNLQSGSGAQVSGAGIFNLGSNSAHGPACDGRVGVHIVAPGWFTDSTSSPGNTSHGISGGTSMASPVVSGAAAIFIERYRDLHDGVTPSPALIKAALTAMSMNMHGRLNADGGEITETPSRFQGWGRLDLDAVVNPAHNVIYFDQEEVFTATGQDWSMSLIADDPDEPVHLMLMWTDAHGHGLAGDTPAWVNILDLAVGADTGTYLGNQIGADGFSQTGGAADDMHNMEGVFLRADQHGGSAFDVTVSAANLTADALNPYDPDPSNPTQDFALVCYNCVAGDAITTFALQLDPPAADACIPRFGTEDVPVDIHVAAAADYTGTVALSTSGEPDGVSSVLEPDAVTAPGDAVWTLSVDNTAVAGETLVTLAGDDGDETQTIELPLNVEAELDAPALIAPEDEAFGVAMPPEFSWQAVPGADRYRIQIATDTIFIANVVMDETVTETQMTATVELEPGAEYFWRVSGDRNCGGAWSEIYSFTTQYHTGELVVTPETLDFDVVDAGAVSVLTFSIEHLGDVDMDPLELTAIESSGDAAFAVIGGGCVPGDMLAPGKSCTMEAGFSPDAVGAFAGEVRVTTIDRQQATVTLNGTGGDPGPVEPDDTLFRDRFEIDGTEAPVVVNDLLPDVHVLEHYELELEAAGGTPPYTWAVDGLPGGLFLDAGTGLISNNPVRPALSGAGDYSVTVEVTDAQGATARATLPLTVIGIARVNLGGGHSCAISSAGRGYCWGHNDQGQLGNGEVGEFQQPNPLPAPIVDPDDPTQPMTGLVDISAWRYHTCALTEAGTVYCWGWDAAGRLGSGTDTGEAVPVPVAVVDPDDPTQPLSDVTGITVGEMHGCASTASGVGYCWGDNFYGQIGTTTTGHHLVPTPVVDPDDPSQPLAGVMQLGGGTFHTCAVIDDGRAYCWGWNVAGQLGNNTTRPGQAPTPMPQPVVDPENVDQSFIGFTHIEGGNVHTCALTVDDTVYCWGQNVYGQLGNDDAPNNSLVPAQVLDPDHLDQPLALSQIDPGGLQSCAVNSSGHAYCWGSNFNGQLGVGDNQDRSVPTPVAAPGGMDSDFDHVRTNAQHTCGVSAGGILYCWGDNAHGELGDGSRVSRNVPVPVRAGM